MGTLCFLLHVPPPRQSGRLPKEAGKGQPSSCPGWSVGTEEGPWFKGGGGVGTYEARCPRLVCSHGLKWSSNAFWNYTWFYLHSKCTSTLLSVRKCKLVALHVYFPLKTLQTFVVQISNCEFCSFLHLVCSKTGLLSFSTNWINQFKKNLDGTKFLTCLKVGRMLCKDHFCSCTGDVTFRSDHLMGIFGTAELSVFLCPLELTSNC